MPRASTTLIFVGTGRVARVDFGPAPARKTRFNWQAVRAGGSSVEQSVEDAVAARQRCGKDVWVLCEDAWTQTIALPGTAITGLSDEEIAAALSFELESLSGLSAVDSAVAFDRCEETPGHLTYWVVQLPRYTLNHVRMIVRQAGGRLRGVCHPAGAPSAWNRGDPPTAWWRIEAWGDVTMCLSADRDGALSRQIINGGPQWESWKPAISAWIQRERPTTVELLDRGGGGRGVDHADLQNATVLPELEGPALDRWLAMWCDALAGRTFTRPMLHPATPQMPRWQYVIIAFSLAGLMAAVCLFHHQLMKREIASANSTITRLEQPRKTVTGLGDQLVSLERELEKLRAAPHKQMPKDDRLVLADQKVRIPALLDGLSKLCHPQRVVTGMAADDHGGVVVSGLSATPDLADHLAVNLAAVLAPHGWTISGAEKTARLTAPSGGPWAFEIALRPADRPTASPAPTAGRAAQVAMRPGAGGGS